MKHFIYRIFEETFPALPFLKKQKDILDKVRNDSEFSQKSERYKELDADCLSNRIKEEHARAVKIDEKTSKFTLGLSVSLTVLAAASGSFIKLIPNSSFSTAISMSCGLASIYMLAAGITALGALKTLATYGYGTEHLINQKKSGISYLAQALYAQERMNIIRQLRNEAAYQSLRNGFLLLLFALALSVAVLTNNKNGLKLENNNIDSSPKSSEEKVLEKKLLAPNAKINNKSVQPTAKTSTH